MMCDNQCTGGVGVRGAGKSRKTSLFDFQGSVPIGELESAGRSRAKRS